MLKTMHIKSYLFIFLLSLSLLQSCSDSDDSGKQNNDEQAADFDGASLPGIYDITFASENGVHVYTFDVDGSVLINYADGTTDTENWEVNGNGELAITGSVDDLFTLTSGNQSSGTLDVILKDEDGTTNTTGTIEVQ